MLIEQSDQFLPDHIIPDYDFPSISSMGNESDFKNSSDSIDYSSTDETDLAYSSFDEEDIAHFVHSIDICLAFFSCLNLIINVWLLILSLGFVRNGCSSSTDSSERRPHYGLHLFIFNCAISAVFLEGIGVVTNVGYLVVGENIFAHGVQSPVTELAIKKILDFVTYSLFNVTHLTFVLLLNVDKLLYILRPLHYHRLMSRRRVCIICVFTWLAAMAMASPSLIYVDVQAQLRQEAILFAMCVVCPAAFDLLSAIIVSTIVYRIQLRDSNTRRSVMGVRRQSRQIQNGDIVESVSAGAARKVSMSVNRANRTSIPVRTINQRRSTISRTFNRHCNVFLRTFTPIIWTCLTTLPYTSLMMYVYFGSDGDDDFVRLWIDDATYKTMRAFGCLYITYFTGLPFIIVFNYFPYRRKIKQATRVVSKRLNNIHASIYAQRYRAISKQDKETCTGVSSAPGTTAGTNTTRTTVTAL